MCLMTTARRVPEPSTLLLYYITDRKQFPGTSEDRERRLLEKIRECAAAGVDYVQLREKDLDARELERLAHKALAAVADSSGSPTKLLINSRTDVALACGAHGVHLPAHDISASDARVIWDLAGMTGAVIGVSVHSRDEVAMAESHGADFAVFGPVFAKDGRSNPQGWEALQRVCQKPMRTESAMPLLALGGITLDNSRRCREAGASGIAGIRLFQEQDPAETIPRLRALCSVTRR